jgi:hypothetical protein
VARRSLVAALAPLALAPLALATVLAGPAGAETSEQVRDLARRAGTDPAALEQLRAVQDIDGRPVDMHAALGDAQGADLARRLETLGSSIGAAPSDGGVAVDGARREAQRILDRPPYRPEEPPRPLRGAIRQVGEWLQPVLEPLGRWLAPVGRLFQRLFDSRLGRGVLGLVIVAIAAVLAALIISRRNRIAPGHDSAPGPQARPADPRDLEKEADDAERAGDLEHAYRLRFVAGVLRLDKAGALTYRDSLTTGELVRTIRSRTFPQLAGTFDEIAYGGRTTTGEDLAQAKADWPRVLQEATR